MITLVFKQTIFNCDKIKNLPHNWTDYKQRSRIQLVLLVLIQYFTHCVKLSFHHNRLGGVFLYFLILGCNTLCSIPRYLTLYLSHREELTAEKIIILIFKRISHNKHRACVSAVFQLRHEDCENSLEICYPYLFQYCVVIQTFPIHESSKNIQYSFRIIRLRLN